MSGISRTIVLLAAALLFPPDLTAGAPAVSVLGAEAGDTAFRPPEPGAAVETAPLSPGPARTEWLKASALYSDGAYSSRAKGMMDTGAPGLVMLQGFHWYADNYWYHPPQGWWGVLADKAGEIGAAGFNLIWFPPVSQGSYYPKEWYNLDSQWGKGDALRRAVREMHGSGVKVLADVVLNHRNGLRDWADFANPDWPTSVVVRNDEWPGSPKSAFDDEGEGDGGCRDLDHRDPAVREDAKVFLRWLRNDIGFDGWRYDMVKGYPARYTGLYNDASDPDFSVGEYYDTDRQRLADWVDGTDASSGKAKASTVFDFTTRYALVDAAESGRYGRLSDGGRPSGFIGWWPAKSVTFVENHDTSPRDPAFIQNAPAGYRAQRLVGYAYILTHPGIPCVFWPHFFDWGPDYRARLQALIDIRKAAGITSVSRVSIAAASDDLYAAVVEGKFRSVAVKLGRSLAWAPGPGWTLEASGESYAVWTR
ncbi:MAG TPA: alpha-amylase C-terminal beta-sheet domain-containing protein [Elusimicrobiales bacterium]|nr:alpha-amylase C-terminal beta-sheet domain-containing protein [Elusimicrobiales bacterium]